MQKKIVKKAEACIAVIRSDMTLMNDAQSALDLISSLYYGDGCLYCNK